MTTYTIQVENPGIEQMMLKFFDVLEKENNITCTRQGKNITLKPAGTYDEMILPGPPMTEEERKKELKKLFSEFEQPQANYDKMILPGPPMTQEEFAKEMEEAEKEIDTGLYWSTDEIRKEFIAWKGSK